MPDPPAVVNQPLHLSGRIAARDGFVKAPLRLVDLRVDIPNLIIGIGNILFHRQRNFKALRLKRRIDVQLERIFGKNLAHTAADQRCQPPAVCGRSLIGIHTVVAFLGGEVGAGAVDIHPDSAERLFHILRQIARPVEIIVIFMLPIRVKALFKKNGRIGMRGKAAERPERFSFFVFEQEQIRHLVVGIVKINRLVEDGQLGLIASQEHDVRVLGVRPTLFVKGHSRPNRYAAESLHILLTVKGKFRPHIAFRDIAAARLRAVDQLENCLDRAFDQRIHRLAGHLFIRRCGMNLKLMVPHGFFRNPCPAGDFAPPARRLAGRGAAQVKRGDQHPFRSRFQIEKAAVKIRPIGPNRLKGPLCGHFGKAAFHNRALRLRTGESFCIFCQRCITTLFRSYRFSSAACGCGASRPAARKWSRRG